MPMTWIRAHATACALITLVIAGAVAAPAATAAPAPTAVLRQHVDRAMAVLQDPKYQGEARATERRAAVRDVASSVFDFEEMSRRALGPHWQGRSPDERQRFVRVFTDLLERAYFSQIDSYAGERVTYVGENVENDSATVRTRIVTERGSEIPVDYRMRQVDGRWRVHDVIIEGVSLVANYRNQFNRVIRTSSFQELVKRLETRASPQG